MIRKRSGIRRRLILLGSAAGRSPISPRGLWRSRLRQALARAAGGVSVSVRAGADPGDDRRGAGPVHLRDLLRMDTFRDLLACPACGGELSGRLVAVRGCGRSLRRRQTGFPTLRLARRRAHRGGRPLLRASAVPGYPPRDSLHALHARAGPQARSRGCCTGRSPATRESSTSGAEPARCASTSRAPTASSSAPI